MLRTTHLTFARTAFVGRRTAAGAFSVSSSAMLMTRVGGSSTFSHHSALSSSTSIAVAQQQRAISWSGIWGGIKGILPLERTTKDAEVLVEEAPDIFEQPPVEVEDYIRPDKTMFESLEDWWDWLLGFMSPVEKQVDAMQHLHTSGFFYGIVPPLSWGATFLVYGAVIRLVTLIPSLYSHRNALRLQKINTPLSEIQQNIKRVKADKTLSAEERKTIQNGYKRMKTALETKAGASQMRSAAQLVTAPLMMTAFWAIGRMTSYEQSLETATFMWVTDLSMPDPTLALPILCAATFVANFELTQRLQRGGRGSLAIYMRWGMRVGVVGFTWFFHNQPAALFLYWMGTSIGGAMQPILLRNQKFRAYFDFPEPAAAGKLELDGVRAPTFWDKMTKPKEKVEEMAAVHSEKLKEAGKTKLMNIDDFEVVVNRKGTGASVKKKKAAAASTAASPAAPEGAAAASKGGKK